MITAPFNFVPLSENVFFPEWSEDVSHDVPFEDSESGVLDIILTAKSPIFVRDAKNKEQFCSHNGEFYIPSTSVKGMVRNVLEIMSFSKMSTFNDDTYAVRDLSSAKNFYMKQMQEPLYCGWLKKSGNDYIIEDCGEPGRIRHEEIDKALNLNFASNFKSDGFEKTSEYKYNLLNGTHKKITVGDLYKSTTNAKYDKRQFCRYSKDGRDAILVVTGQPTKRTDSGKMGDGKGFEFVFFDTKKEIKLTDKAMKNFLFAYFDERNTEPKESPDWTFWKEKLNNDEKVPVFFQKNGASIAHFGLSYLYKLPYKHSVKDGLSKAHSQSNLDLAQTMFGYVDKKNALKGRVQFSHFKATQNVSQMKRRTEVLGTPRASYYPMYVKQGKELFTTFMDEFSIAGWKRYPIHNGATTTKTESTENENIGTSFTPLKEGVVFKGKLRYHNLKKAELGALLSALTFHNTTKTFHNIGMAKPLGYGKVEVKLEGITNLEEYLKAFELEISTEINEWGQTEQIKELLTMSTEQNNSGNSQLKYMLLKEFADNKSKNKDCLRSYSTLQNIQTTQVKTLISQDDLDQLKIKQEELKEAQKVKEQLALEKEKLNNDLAEVQKSDNIQIIQNFINRYPEYENLEEIKTKLQEMQKAQESNKHQKVNNTAQKAFDGIHDPKYKASLQKSLQSFIKKWEAKKNHKGSEFVLDLVEKAKAELK